MVGVELGARSVVGGGPHISDELYREQPRARRVLVSLRARLLVESLASLGMTSVGSVDDQRSRAG